MRRNRAWSDPVKIKAKFPRNILSDYKDDSVTMLEDDHNKCIYESRSPGTIKERVRKWVPKFD